MSDNEATTPWPCGNLDRSHDGEHCRTCWLLLSTDGRPLDDHEQSRLTAGEVRERADEYDAMEARALAAEAALAQIIPCPEFTDQRGPIFDEVPSALHIMHWFLDKQMAKEWVGCGGDADYILSWDPETQAGCHVDLIAHVDHDASWFWLLSVGTQLDGGPTSYDLLFIAADLDGKRSCEWRNEPSSYQPWRYDGLVWFAGQIEERSLAASRPDVAPREDQP